MAEKDSVILTDDHLRSRKRRSCVLLGICCCLLCVAFIAVLIIQHVLQFERTSYAVVVDAGSSSSKIYLYKWPSSKFRGSGVIRQVGEQCKTDDPLEKEIGKVNGFLASKEFKKEERSCIEEAKKHIPRRRMSNSRLFLGATAGMRLLRSRNASTANAVMKKARQRLQKYGLMVENPRADISILSGSQEGMGAWITANYLHGTFGDRDSGQLDPKPPEQSRGSLDLGGASTQIAFAVDAKSGEKSNNTYTRRIYGQEYSVYSNSFLCFGKNEAEMRLLAAIAIEKSKKSASLVFENPCANRGYSYSIDSVELFQQPCRLGNRSFEVYGSILNDIPQSLLHKKLMFKGVWDPSHCNNHIQRMFNTTACNSTTSCAFTDVTIPKINGQFYAFAGYYYTAEVLNFTGKGHTYNNINVSIAKECTRRMNASFSGKESYKFFYCFDAMYVVQLLTRFGFRDENVRNTSFVKKIDGDDVSWSMGFMINATEHIPSERPYRAIEPRTLFYAIVGCLFVGIFACMATLICLQYRWHVRRQRVDSSAALVPATV